LKLPDNRYQQTSSVEEKLQRPECGDDEKNFVSEQLDKNKKRQKRNKSSGASREKHHKLKSKKKLLRSKSPETTDQNNIEPRLLKTSKISKSERSSAIKSGNVKGAVLPRSNTLSPIACDAEQQPKRKTVRLVGADSVLIGGRLHNSRVVQKEEKGADEAGGEKSMLIMNRKGDGDVNNRIRPPIEDTGKGTTYDFML